MKEWQAQQPPDPPPPEGSTRHSTNSPIGKFISAHGPDWMLEYLQAHGYQLKRSHKGNHGIGYRLLAPESTTGMPGVILDQNAAGKWTVYSNHGDVLGQKRVQHDAFDLYTLFDHGGDAKAALREFHKGENVREESKGHEQDSNDKSRSNGFMFFSATRWQGQEPKPREWVWEDWLPRGYVTGLGGPPGSSKSTLVQILATHIAIGRDYLGAPGHPGTGHCYFLRG